MGLSLEKALEKIGRSEIAPGYLIFGDDERIVFRAADKLAEAIVPEEQRDINLVWFEAGEVSPQAIAEELMNMPLFPSNKAVLIKGHTFFLSSVGGSKKTDQKKPDLENMLVLERALATPPPQGHAFILAFLNVDIKTAAYKGISKKCTVMDLTLGKDSSGKQKALHEVAANVLGELDVKLSPKALAALEKKTGFDTRTFTNQLAKLASYVGKGATITAKDVEALCDRTKEESIFELNEAVAKKNLKAALLSLNELTKDGVYHLQILNAIHRECRNLLMAKLELKNLPKGSFRTGMRYPAFKQNVFPLLGSDSEAKERKSKGLSSSHPYVAFKAINNCTNFSSGELTTALELLYEIDLKIKTSSVNPRLLIEEFLIRTLQ